MLAAMRTVMRMPPHLLARLVATRLRRIAAESVERRRDGRRSPYLDRGSAPRRLEGRLTTIDATALAQHADGLAALTRQYLAHRFDILGSGWVAARHGMRAAGLEGYRYESSEPVTPDPDGSWLVGRLPATALETSRRVWSLVDEGYVPIDWQLDLKSGWRWSEKTWHGDIGHGHRPGADIKVPWELARLHHLPRLAAAALLAPSHPGTMQQPERYFREIRNQVLDFVATNPPRFGVNWASPMDVAIRCVNLVIAHDLCRVAGASFDSDFESVIAASVADHGLFISRHLEWDPRFRGNHYLADLCGLAFAGAYLPPSKEARRWLQFAAREIHREAQLQFHQDGTNFEASTAYHCLSTEIVLMTVSLFRGLEAEGRFTTGFDWMSWAVRLGRASDFIHDVTRPTGRLSQIGDDDSGRLLKLAPRLRLGVAAGTGEDTAGPADSTPREEHLDHRPLAAVIDAFVGGRRELEQVAFEVAVIDGLSRGARLMRPEPPGVARNRRIGSDADFDRARATIAAIDAEHRRIVTIPVPGWTLQPSIRAYPDFGAYIAATGDAHLVIRCGPVGQNGLGGHAHNDQLSIELTVGGVELIRDSGSYLYTADPEIRRRYRSIDAHFTPQLHGGEPASLDMGPFRLGPGSHGICTYWGPRGFAGGATMVGARAVMACISWRTDAIELSYGAVGAVFRDRWAPPGTDWRARRPDIAWSPGYGIVEGGP